MEPKWHLTKEGIQKVISEVRKENAEANPFTIYLATQREQKLKEMDAELDIEDSLAFDFLVEGGKTNGRFN